MGLQQEGLDYRGFIFIGVIKVGDEPFVIEYNCRMGDPETEVVMPRLMSDLVDLLVAAARQELHDSTITLDPRFATTIVAVSRGYPNHFEKGYEIKGLQETVEDSILFHSGTAMEEDKIVSNGGRVLCATALAPTLYGAINKSKERLQQVKFEDMYYRRDIGFEFI